MVSQLASSGGQSSSVAASLIKKQGHAVKMRVMAQQKEEAEKGLKRSQLVMVVA